MRSEGAACPQIRAKPAVAGSCVGPATDLIPDTSAIVTGGEGRGFPDAVEGVALGRLGAAEGVGLSVGEPGPPAAACPDEEPPGTSVSRARPARGPAATRATR